MNTKVGIDKFVWCR